MARYISRASQFKKTVARAATQIVETVHGPVTHEVGRSTIAFFQQGGATPYEVELAQERFKFTGLAEGELPTRRLSVYDTDEQARLHGWDPELKAEIEATLDAGQSADYFRVEPQPAPAPWPTYDQLDAAAVVKAVPLLGSDPDMVLAYERAHKNRKSVIDALSQAAAQHADSGIEVPA